MPNPTPTNEDLTVTTDDRVTITADFTADDHDGERPNDDDHDPEE